MEILEGMFHSQEANQIFVAKRRECDKAGYHLREFPLHKENGKEQLYCCGYCLTEYKK